MTEPHRVLQNEIDAGRRTVRSEAMSMSIGEIANLYERRELKIRPEFQRLFRWDSHQKSRLIESIFLGIPLPSIFVIQNDDGVWELIDGLQRCSTIFEFMGILRDEVTGQVKGPAQLTSTKFLPSLESIEFSEGSDDSLSQPQRLAFKRSKLDIRILLPESDERTKYELFDRLNSGGQQASAQEIRNVQLLLADSNSLSWIQSLARRDDYISCVSLSDNKYDQQYDLDLVCRLIAFFYSSEEELRQMVSVDEYVTQKLRVLFGEKNFNYASFEDDFTQLFEILSLSLGESSFKKFDFIQERHVRGFSVSAFEAVTHGVLHNLQIWSKNSSELPGRVAQMWAEQTFTENTRAGVRGTTRIATVLPWAKVYYSSTSVKA